VDDVTTVPTDTPNPARLLGVVRRSVSTPLDAIMTAVVALVVAAAALPVARWAVTDAVWSGSADDCRASSGACWAFVGQKLSFIVFGLYPQAERWRAGIALGVLVALVMLTAVPRLWRRSLLVAWALGLVAAFWLMRGGAGLTRVPTRLWGGLPITVMLTAAGLSLGFPIALRSRWGAGRGCRSRAPWRRYSSRWSGASR
jgi:general L-amino acid transport system permease protein